MMFIFDSTPPHPHLPLFFFFFNDTATTEIYTLSLHALFRSLLERRHAEPRYQRDHAQRRSHRAVRGGNGDEGQPAAYHEAVAGRAHGDSGEHGGRFIHHRQHPPLGGVRGPPPAAPTEDRRGVPPLG